MRRWILVLLALAAIFVPFIISNQNKEAQATRRTFRAVNSAEAKLAPLEVVTIADYQRHIAELKAIDTRETPEPVRAALNRYIAALEKFIQDRKPDSEITWVDEKLVEAQLEFERAMSRFRGQPF